MARRWGLAVLYAVLACGSLSCDRDEHPRQALFGLPTDDPVQALFASPARLTVIYWPAEGCPACGAPIEVALSEVVERFPDIRWIEVVPASSAHPPVSSTRRDAPKRQRVSMDENSYARHLAPGPLPRIEVWSADGDLLLLRSVPPQAAQAALLVEEITWSRSFTAPLPTGGRS